ncbi:TonB-dependent receptor [Aggregatimonas sangjinii]|uniref:TonB-dependent receptor n=1 Tax=Aggregatimonas sangjinii TaxID=2583587 RepID=A0A5B7SUC9_9FLAO|nr:carboxypeptidase-like regulatory domain-containing protein [Aggregatimonas sangjinii]QCX00471.1 TonB-dependent receptor [Aggregatimonas sangjinii]
MLKSITFLFLLLSTVLLSQTTISGTVTDTKGIPIQGANAYLEGTYDGASTDENGNFTFDTVETGTQNLIVSMLSYDPFMQAGDVSYLENMKIEMREAINQLTGVTLTAGTFEAGDNSKVSVLKPLDIVTTAGAVGDFVGALQTLPGTSTVSEDGRLFVRGGEAGETQVFIDGLRVFQPFSATANNIPTRGRFSPFLFKGITFSTGGYSAEYGQALSSVLLLNTTDVPDQEKTELQVMSVGGGVGHTEIWGDESLSVNASYINLAPYQWLVPNDRGAKWNKPYKSISGEAVFRSKKEKSMFKFYTGFTQANLDIEQEDINFEDFVNFKLKNNNLYANTSYKHFLEKEWTFTTGASISLDTNDIGIQTNTIDTKETAGHVKVKIKKNFSSRFQLNFGAEHFVTDYTESFLSSDGFSFDSDYRDNLSAGFIETDIFLSNKFAMKLGVRGEYSAALADFNVSPRISIAYKSGDKSQFSLAYGDFYQNPFTEYLKFDQSLDFEKTEHYILNYQYLANGKTFRVEAYHKDYHNLVKYDTQFAQFDSRFDNTGSGYASGLDVFWRDNKSIKNLDYWVSYSYLNTERDYRNFSEKATPNFAPEHNFSLVTKYFIEDWKSQVGISYTYAAGRPYDNPNTSDFLSEKTKPYHSLSVNWAYLLSPQKILYCSVSNVAGFNNINGYQYADAPNANGQFDRLAIRPTADTFFFVGFFWTISDNKSDNQLDNL